MDQQTNKQTRMEKKEDVLILKAAARNRRLQLMGSSKHSMLLFHLTKLDLKTMKHYNAQSPSPSNSSNDETPNFSIGPERSIGSKRIRKGANWRKNTNQVQKRRSCSKKWSNLANFFSQRTYSCYVDLDSKIILYFICWSQFHLNFHWHKIL